MKKTLFIRIFAAFFVLFMGHSQNLQAQCANADFGTGSLTGGGWTGGWGDGLLCFAPNPLTNIGFNPGALNSAPNSIPQTNHAIMTGGNDPFLLSFGAAYSVPVTWPGNPYSARLGNTYANGDAEEMTYTFVVTPSNCNFTYHYAVALNDGGHNPGEQPFFNISMMDVTTSSPITCAAYQVDASSASSIGGFTTIPDATTGLGPVLYKPWSSVLVPLNQYIGHTMTITFLTQSCNPCVLGICCPGSHFAYAYIAADCAPLQIVAPSPTICGGSTLTLTAPAGAGSYSWSGPGVIAPTNQQTVTVNQAGRYKVDMTTLSSSGTGGCPFSLDTMITLNPSNPDANFSSTTVCVGSPTLFTDLSTPVGSVTWAWDFNNSGTINSRVQNPTYTFPSAGTYPVKLSVTLAPCTIDTVLNVVVAPIPDPGFTAISPVCTGVTSTITYAGNAPAGATYNWNFDGGTVVSGTGQGPYQVSWATGGTKNVVLSVTIGNCTSPDTTVLVVVNQTPVVTVSPDVVICTGGNTTLTAAGGATNYTWAPGTNLSATTGATVTANPSSTITYAVTGTTAGCWDSASVTVTVAPVPTSGIAPVPAVCAGANATITYTGNAPAGATYNWNFGGGIVVSGSGQGPYQVNWSTAGNPTITLTVTVGTCVSSPGSISVVVNASPTVTVSPDVAICAGGSTPLVAAGGTSYTWAPAAGLSATNVASVTATPVSTTTYAVTGTTNGCSDSASVTVTVNPVPTATLSATPACTGANSTVTYTGNAPAGATYNWNFGTGTVVSGSGQGPYQVTWNTAGTQTINLTVTMGTCVSQPGTGSAVITATPAVTLSPDVTICTGTSTVLTAAGATTYAWTPATGLSATTGASVTATPAITTAYTVTGTTGLCSNTATVNVTIAAAPNVTVNNPSSCQGGNDTITAVPTIAGGTFSWTPGGGTTASIIVTPASATAYTVTYTIVNCGSGTATSNVTVWPLPAVALTPENLLCGATNTGVILANASAGTPPFQYSLNGGVNQPADSFTNLTAGSYRVDVYDSHNCNANNTASILPSTAVTSNLTTVSPTCGNNNGQIVVNAQGGTSPYQYSLNAGAGQASNTFTGLGGGFYTIVVTDITGCTNTDTTTLPNSTALTVNLTTDSVKCFGASDGLVKALAAGGVPPYQYQLNAAPFETNDSFAVSIGTYTVNVQDQGGCTATASAQVGQPGPLVFDSIVPSAVKCVGDKNGTIAVYSSGGIQPYNYSCTRDFANFAFATNGLIVGLDTGFYTVVLSDNNGCTLTDTTTVPNALPDFYKVTTDTTSCYGKQYKDGAIHITATPTANDPFQFSTDGTSFQDSDAFYGLGAGLYNVSARNKNNCPTYIPNVVVPEPLQAFASVMPADTSLQLGQSIQLATSFWPYALSTVVSYAWTPSIGLSCIDCPNPTLTSYAYQNTYTVTVTYNGHCTADAYSTVVVLDKPQIFIPNSFTPNGDGNNDVFLIYGANIKTIEMKVFNRWGELVFESKNQFQGWDGVYKSLLQNPGVYVYEANITMLDDKQVYRKGTVTLIR